MRLAAAIVALALFASSSSAREPSYGHSSHEFYRSTDGRMVHGPTRTANPAYGRVSASCRDGTQSYSTMPAGLARAMAGWRHFAENDGIRLKARPAGPGAPTGRHCKPRSQAPGRELSLQSGANYFDIEGCAVPGNTSSKLATNHARPRENSRPPVTPEFSNGNSGL